MERSPLPPPVSRRIDIICAAIVLPLVFRIAFAQLFAPDHNLATQQDNTYQLVPIFSFLSQSFLHGEYPYWMNSILSGMSMFNDPDFSPAYPFYFLRFNWFATPLAAMSAIHWITVLHLFVLYVNSYFMLRCMRVRPLAAFLGASLFALSQNSISYAGWINITASYAWLPLVIGAVVLILDRRPGARPVIVGAVGLALLTLASPSQPLIHVMFIGGVLTLARFFAWFVRRDYRIIATAARDLIAMGALALLLSAPSVVPALLNVNNMIRFLGDLPPVTDGMKMPFEATLVGQMSPAQLASILVPLQVPLIVGSWFIGLSTVLFGLVGLLDIRRHWLIAPLVLLTAYGLLSALGSHTGFAQINYHVPLLNLIREPPRHMIVFMLGAAGLAAFGFDRLTDAISRGWPAGETRSLAVVAAVFVAILVTASRTSLAYAGTVPLWLILAGFAGVVGLLVVAAWLPQPARTMAFASAAGLAIGANLGHPHANLHLWANDYFRQANLASHRVLEEVGRIPDVRRYRVVFEPTELQSTLWSMNGSYYGLRSFQAFKNPVTNARQFAEVFQAQNVRHYPALLGAKYYLCGSCNQVDKSSYRLDREIEGHRLYVADSALPPFFVVGRVAGLYDTRNDFVERLESGFDFSREVYIDRAVPVPRLDVLLAAPKDALHAVVKEERRSLNVVELSVSTNRPAIVVLNEYFTNAWRTTINGVPQQSIRVNLNQVGVPIETGASLVKFEYRPVVFVRLLQLQAVAVVILGIWMTRRTWVAGRKWWTTSPSPR